jgi:hypothetical protein
MGIGTQKQGTGATEKKKFEPINPGTYVLKLDQVIDKTSKAGDSKYKDLVFKVSEGDNAGRLIFNTRLFYQGSRKAIEVSNDKANKLLKALGVNGGMNELGNDLGALEDFIGTDVVAKVDVEYPQGFSARNIIKSFQRR